MLDIKTKCGKLKETKSKTLVYIEFSVHKIKSTPAARGKKTKTTRLYSEIEVGSHTPI